MFLDCFDMLISKIKKNLFWYIFKQKILWKVTATTIPKELQITKLVFFKVFFSWKYIKIIFYFLNQHIKTIQNFKF
jgi:hypothetical protein